jgi:hypothetical protein
MILIVVAILVIAAGACAGGMVAGKKNRGSTAPVSSSQNPPSTTNDEGTTTEDEYPIQSEDRPWGEQDADATDNTTSTSNGNQTTVEESPFTPIDEETEEPVPEEVVPDDPHEQPPVPATTMPYPSPTAMPSPAPTLPPTAIFSPSHTLPPAAMPSPSNTSFPTAMTPLPTASTSPPVVLSPPPTANTSPPTNLPPPPSTLPPIAFESNEDVLVGVYYYPWYHNDDFNGKKYLRGKLDPPQYPALGEYNLREPGPIGQHLAWTRGANINLWVTSWWGPFSSTDENVKDYILPHPDFAGTKIALFYETAGRVPDFVNTGNVYNDIVYMSNTYFDNPNYLKINGKPVIYVYLTRVLEEKGTLAQIVDLMRSAASDNGHDIYIVGDHAFYKPPTSDAYAPFQLLDAVTNYDMYGCMESPRFAELEGVAEYREHQSGWREKAKGQNCDFIPAISPGYNEEAVRSNTASAMSRRISENAPVGSLFQAVLSDAFDLVDEATGKILMINSWNEWHEDTQIEPTVSGGTTSVPSELTQGLRYKAYGELFLDIVRAATNGEDMALPNDRM